MSGGGGQVLVGKWGRVPDGGIDQIFANWGDSPRENPELHCSDIVPFINSTLYEIHKDFPTRCLAAMCAHETILCGPGNQILYIFAELWNQNVLYYNLLVELMHCLNC